MKKEFYCECCGFRAYPIGTFDTDTITDPFRGDMFGSIDTAHGFPPPFQPDATFRDLIHNVCGKRAILEEGRLLVGRDEYYHVFEQPEPQPAQQPEPQETVLRCNFCGQRFDSEAKMEAHKALKHTKRKGGKK